MASNIFMAIKDGLQVTRKMLEDNEDIDVNKVVRGRFCCTPLHYACLYGNLEVVKYLIVEKKANVNSLDARGWTPLYQVCITNGCGKTGKWINVAEFLLTNGADVNVKARDGTASALHQACYWGSHHLVQVLLNHGAHIHAKASISEQRTPLHYACLCQHIDVIKILMTNNADRHIQDSFGRVPADLLQDSGLEEVFQSYDKWPLAVSAAAVDDKIMQATTTPKKFAHQGGTMVGLNPYLSQHQHTLALKTILLVRRLPVHEVALEILGFLTPAAVEKIFKPPAVY